MAREPVKGSKMPLSLRTVRSSDPSAPAAPLFSSNSPFSGEHPSLLVTATVSATGHKEVKLAVIGVF